MKWDVLLGWTEIQTFSHWQPSDFLSLFLSPLSFFPNTIKPVPELRIPLIAMPYSIIRLSKNIPDLYFWYSFFMGFKSGADVNWCMFVKQTDQQNLQCVWCWVDDSKQAGIVDCCNFPGVLHSWVTSFITQLTCTDSAEAVSSIFNVWTHELRVYCKTSTAVCTCWRNRWAVGHIVKAGDV